MWAICHHQTMLDPKKLLISGFAPWRSMAVALTGNRQLPRTLIARGSSGFSAAPIADPKFNTGPARYRPCRPLVETVASTTKEMAAPCGAAKFESG